MWMLNQIVKLSQIEPYVLSQIEPETMSQIE